MEGNHPASPDGPDTSPVHGGILARAEAWARQPGPLQRLLPAIAFVGGFCWDVFTIGRAIKPVDLWILSGYYTICATILVLRGRDAHFRGSRYLNLALQFFLGNIFSALVVFYFISAGSFWGFVIVSALAAMLVSNEFLERHYEKLTLSWTLLTVSGVMLLNFILPHLFRSISPLWFHASTAAAVALAALLNRISLRKHKLWPTIAVALVLMSMHMMNLIPPVPLVGKRLVVGHDVRRTASEYLVTVEPRARLMFWRPTVVHKAPGARVWCASSIFVPRGIETTVSHHWLRLEAGQWVTKSVVPFPIRGGRLDGYRAYSFKANIPAGEWKVIVETTQGQTIASTRFRVEESAGGPRRTRTIRL
ncbi:MAG: DUF2914 domain-containing protein [Thermoanaerobaculia bacterium]|nr:DUF2914 domain-containing protein [Thermoanaerobaculia bacterium]